jgi:hypothetical protein
VQPQRTLHNRPFGYPDGNKNRVLQYFNEVGFKKMSKINSFNDERGIKIE